MIEPTLIQKPEALSGLSLELDAWQEEALVALLDGEHVVVDAPTSAGKTRVIEAYLELKLAGGTRLTYTSPVKSLSYDKYREFTRKYGLQNVGINTGDFKENLQAPIILATLETYRNSLLGLEPDILRSLVVYDEYHFLQDESRGSAWEEALILTPPTTQLLLLSASVPNADDFAGWIEHLTNRKVRVVRVAKRPVPLVHLVSGAGGLVRADVLNLSENKIKSAKKDVQKKALLAHELAPVLSQALEIGIGPIVVYASRRGDVEQLAQRLPKFLKGQIDREWLVKVRARVKDIPGFSFVPEGLQRLILDYAMAYHHSGLMHTVRMVVETLLKEGLLIVCCATMGISLGVNFAVRSALIADTSRPSDGGPIAYSQVEIMQMLGRAGRRGFDKQGFSIWPDLSRYILQKPGKDRPPCTSALKFDPSTILSILDRESSLKYLSDFYKKSFFAYEKQKKQPDPSKSHVGAIIKQRLDKIVTHLQTIGALTKSQTTIFGKLACHFPQAGGLLIAYWLSKGDMNATSWPDYLQVMGVFCSAHFKDIPTPYAKLPFLRSLKMERFVGQFYPVHLFKELYDERTSFNNKAACFGPEELMFRDFNYGAASIVQQWLNPDTQWQQLVAKHASMTFSDGDCMNVLFRFATFLQSCARLDTFDEEIAKTSRNLLKTLLRSPLDVAEQFLQI